MLELLVIIQFLHRNVVANGGVVSLFRIQNEHSQQPTMGLNQQNGDMCSYCFCYIYIYMYLCNYIYYNVCIIYIYIYILNKMGTSMLLCMYIYTCRMGDTTRFSETVARDLFPRAPERRVLRKRNS